MKALLQSYPLLMPALWGLVAMLLLATATWWISLVKSDVSIVDSVWSLMIVTAGTVYSLLAAGMSERAGLVLALTVVWALRLAVYITWRNWGEGEDRRYRAIRARNEPHFKWKSLYLVFGLQAGLAWIVSLCLLAAIAGSRAPSWLDDLGMAVVLFGIAFETLADAQLAAFKSLPENQGQVLRSGLWRYTRHPNYFGECCVWWGFFLIALSAGGWWAIVAPVLMTLLLLKVSGVTLLEKDIAERRPEYRDYIARTNAFLPWNPRA